MEMEYLDIYDENGKFLGSEERSKVHKEALWHNTVHCWLYDKEGNVYGVCLGSGCSMEASYYDGIPAHKNDDHGTGIILMAAAEMMRNGNKK